MLSVSKYNIYLKLKKHQDSYLIIQGYRGSFDLVRESIVKSLQNGVNNPSLLEQIDKKNLNMLIKRGYITEYDEQEELAIIRDISHIINRINRKNMCVTIIPSYQCNFRCEYCFEQNLFLREKKWINTRMTKAIADAVFSQLREFRQQGIKIGNVFLFGGEPLLKSNLDIIRYISTKCQEQGIPIVCVSNGYYLDDFIELIREFQFQKVQITLDGIGSEHDKRRFLADGTGSYAKITNNIQLALDNGIPIELRTNVNKKNVSAIPDLIAAYQKKGWVGYDIFTYYFKSTLRCYEELSTALSDVELMKVLSAQYGESIDRFQFNSIYRGLAVSIRTMIASQGIAPLRSGYCGANTGMYVIDPFGDIYPCWDVLAEEEARIGRVDTQKGKFVFNENHDLWKERTVDRMDDCRKCRYLLFCGGGCSAQARVMNSDLNKAFCDNFVKIFDEVAADICENAIEDLLRQ